MELIVDIFQSIKKDIIKTITNANTTTKHECTNDLLIPFLQRFHSYLQHHYRFHVGLDMLHCVL